MESRIISLYLGLMASFFLSSFAGAAATGPQDRSQRIAIIGAGPSGLTAAHNLRQLGYSHVTVFEKNADVGGKVLTTFYQGRPYELGAIIANHDYTTVMALAKEYNQTVSGSAESFLVDKQGGKYSYVDYVKQKYGLVKFLKSVSLFWATMARYADLEKPGFANSSPDLFASMTDFATTQQIVPAAEIVASFLTGCGYGYYDEIPALYLMKLAPWVLNQPILDAVSAGKSQTWSMFDHGWQQLWREVAKDLNVKLNAEVTSIKRKRGDGGLTISVTANGIEQTFDRIIIAAPLDKIVKVMDAKPIEKDLFGRIKNLRYLVTMVEGEGMAMASFYDNVGPESIGHINFVVQRHPDTNVFLIYQLLDKNMSIAQAEYLANQDLSAQHAKIKKVIMRKEWSYFPHVESSDLDSGYYEKLENLQGEDGTYYVGGLMSFETVEHTSAYAKQLVLKFFN